MNKNLLVWIGLLVALGILSAALTYWRADKMSPLADIASKGLATVQRSNLIFFGIAVPLMVGVAGFFVYRGMLARAPEAANNSFLLLAMAIGVALTIMAAVVFRMRGFAEFAVLHVLYIAGLGWLYPLLMAK